MGIKYFCDKCGKEVNKDEFITLKVKLGLEKIEDKFFIIEDDKKAFMCKDCKIDFAIDFKRLKEKFNII